jgi:hypothetical protein
VESIDTRRAGVVKSTSRILTGERWTERGVELWIVGWLEGEPRSGEMAGAADEWCHKRSALHVKFVAAIETLSSRGLVVRPGGGVSSHPVRPLIRVPSHHCRIPCVSIMPTRIPPQRHPRNPVAPSQITAVGDRGWRAGSWRRLYGRACGWPQPQGAGVGAMPQRKPAPMPKGLTGKMTSMICASQGVAGPGRSARAMPSICDGKNRSRRHSDCCGFVPWRPGETALGRGVSC